MNIKNWVMFLFILSIAQNSFASSKLLWERFLHISESRSGGSLIFECSGNVFKYEKANTNEFLSFRSDLDWSELDIVESKDTGLIFEGLGSTAGASKNNTNIQANMPIFNKKPTSAKGRNVGVMYYFEKTDNKVFTPYRYTLDFYSGKRVGKNLREIYDEYAFNSDRYKEEQSYIYKWKGKTKPFSIYLSTAESSTDIRDEITKVEKEIQTIKARRASLIRNSKVSSEEKLNNPARKSVESFLTEFERSYIDSYNLQITMSPGLKEELSEISLPMISRMMHKAKLRKEQAIENYKSKPMDIELSNEELNNEFKSNSVSSFLAHPGIDLSQMIKIDSDIKFREIKVSDLSRTVDQYLIFEIERKENNSEKSTQNAAVLKAIKSISSPVTVTTGIFKDIREDYCYLSN